MDIHSIFCLEDDYAKCFCSVFEDENIIRFRDDLIPDMYDHNYSQIKQTRHTDDMKRLVMKEIEFCASEGRTFCNIYLNGNVDLPFVRELGIKAEETSYGIYATDCPAELRLEKRDDCNIEKVTNEAMLAERLALELAEYGDKYGADFCKRKSERMKRRYLGCGGEDTYVCRTAEGVVGKCNLFVERGIAKIEDFDVAASHRRKGFGTAIIHKLVSDAVEMGARCIYLVTDMEDTAKEMYAKLGFKEVAYKKQVFFHLP